MRRKNCCNGCGGAWLSIAVGFLILLGLILPAAFWWVICASSFICGGILLLRR